MQKFIVWIIVIAVVIFGISLLLRRSTPMTDVSPTVNTETPPVTDTNPPVDINPTSAVKEFTVTGQNYSFAPATLTVKKGDTVKITFKNAEGNHDLRIDEFNVATERIQSGGEQTVTFIADKTGSFQYYCSVGNHRAMGMWGTLTVTE